MFEYIHNDESVVKLRENNRMMGASINAVKGFSPEAEARALENNGEITSGISKNIKEQWFRLVHPTGCVTFDILAPTTDFVQKVGVDKVSYVEVKCSIYATPSDVHPLGQGIGYALAEDFDLTPSPAKRYAEMVRLAKGQAEAKAYYSAGFGLQFYGDSDFDELRDIAINNPVKEAKITEPTIETPTMFATDEAEPTPAAVEKKDGTRKKRNNTEIFNDSVEACRSRIDKIKELIVLQQTSPSKAVDIQLAKEEKAWRKNAETALQKLETLEDKDDNTCTLPEFELDFDKCFRQADGADAYIEAYYGEHEEAAAEMMAGLDAEAEMMHEVAEVSAAATTEAPTETVETIEAPVEVVSEAVSEAVAIDETHEQLEIAGSLYHPEDVRCTLQNSLNGKTIGEIMEEKKTKKAVFYLLNHSDEITQEEVNACKEIIRNDEELRKLAEAKKIAV